jgi:hypothetical protein
VRAAVAGAARLLGRAAWLAVCPVTVVVALEQLDGLLGGGIGGQAGLRGALCGRLGGGGWGVVAGVALPVWAAGL